MAFAFSVAGTQTADKAGGVASKAFVTGFIAAAGDLVVICGPCVTGGTADTFSCTDSVGGNTWTQALAGPGGNVNKTFIFYSRLVNGLAATDTITITTSANYSKIAATPLKFTVGGAVTTDSSPGASTGGSVSPSSVAGTPPTAVTLIVGSLGWSGISTDFTTGGAEDTDNVGGDTWHTAVTANATSGGGATANITQHAAYKITTSSASQQYNPTLGTSRTWNCGHVALKEALVAPSQVQHTPRVVSQHWERAATWMKRRSGIVVPRLWTPADGLA